MRLNKKELSFLSKIFPQTNSLSLFSSITVPLQGDEQKTLEEKGVLAGEKLTQEASNLFGTVANPRRCTRLVLKDGSYLIEKYAYKSDEGFVLAENSGSEIIFSAAQKLDEAMFQLSQWIGMSDLKTFDMETLLTSGELLVFLALVDIRRANVLLSYLGREEKSEISFTQVRQQLDKPEPGSLTRILIGNYNYSIPQIEDTKEILDQLVTKKIVTFNVGYSLIDQYEEFAKKFLISQTVVMLETFNLTEKNEIAGAGVLCVCAGMREIVSIVFREGEAEIASISGRQLLKMMEDFLNCPDVLQDEA
ncbi:MAG: hypothetical protein PHI90_03910 [Clostridia bacterium]|nr:hypothetical protein [Clostridia bacterium]MDD4047963.1 hypothetical protein [Clostridia bacterium]